MECLYDNISDKQRRLIEAVKIGDMGLVKHMVEVEGVDPNIGDDPEDVQINPICWASLNGHVDLAFYLIDTDKIKLSEKLGRYVGSVINDVSTSNYIFQKIK